MTGRREKRCRPLWHAAVSLLWLTVPQQAGAQLASEPFHLAGTLIIDSLANVSGGLRRGGGVLKKLDLSASYDAAFGLEPVNAYTSLQATDGHFSEMHVGEAQAISNIEAVPALRLFEAWVRVESDALWAKAGLIDLNAEFDVQQVGRLFLNASHGIGPDFSQTGANGPSIFPTAAGGIVMGMESDALSARMGLFDAIAGEPAHPRRTVLRLPGRHGLLLVGEVDRKFGAGELQLGAWAYTSRFDAITRRDPSGYPSRLRGNQGVYAQVERRLAGRESGHRLDGWVRVGVARAAINPIKVYAGGGLVHSDGDTSIGLAIAHARLGHPALRAGLTANQALRTAETNIELSYRRRVADWLEIQPDVQLVLNPGWSPSRHAFIAGFRLAVSFD